MKRVLCGFLGLVVLAGCSGALDLDATGTGKGASTGEGTPTETPSSPARAAPTPATPASPPVDPPSTPPSPPATPGDPPPATPPSVPPSTPPADPPADPPPADPPADPPPADPPADPPPPPVGVSCTSTITTHVALGPSTCDYSQPPTVTTTTETDVPVSRNTSPAQLCITSAIVRQYTNSSSSRVCLWGPNGGSAAYVGSITVSSSGTIANVSLSGARSYGGPCRTLSIVCSGSTTIK